MESDAESNASRASSTSLQHRRPPAHRSVSLRHWNSANGDNSRAQSRDPQQHSVARHGPPQKPSSSPSSLKPLVGKDDSGESSNAERWFEKSNNNASGQSPSYVDNSPPFFLQNSSSEETTLDAVMARHAMLNCGQARSPLQPVSLVRIGTNNSSNEDFRAVIDDLTIENKKLKRKLKSYQKLQDSHLKDEKLFEVRVHGLPAQKKQELEEILRKFAMDLRYMPDTKTNQSQPGSNLRPSPNAQSGSSSLSTNPFTDSAYASGTASGQGSSSRSMSDTKKRTPSSTTRIEKQNIHTYLHDIPAGLLPQTGNMDEKTKKRLVVRRLEQIFAGKGADAGNQQPQQQEEVSQSAARADRQQFLKVQGHNAPLEGIREARMMGAIASTDFAGQLEENADTTGHDKSKPVSSPKKAARLEQRPTRPLDLDPHRAQVAADNIGYIRHLGFSPKHFGSMTPPADGHGWIYLNLLVNMAQLHTINVTPEFIREAVQSHSKKFELSDDGRKIRWKGGKSMTLSSADGDNSPSSMSNPTSTDQDVPRKKLKTSKQGDAELGAMPLKSGKLAWTPLFHHRSSTEDSGLSDSSDEDEFIESNTDLAPPGGVSSGMTGSGARTDMAKKSVKRENGPIIFYNNAKFCTDLSGDNKVDETMMYNAFLYHNLARQPIGIAPSRSGSSVGGDCKGPLADLQEFPEAMDVEDNPIPATKELTFPTPSPLTSQPGNDANAIRFEVSGLGGVYPADNFTINVKSKHARSDDKKAPTTAEREMPSRYPAAISNILAGQPTRKARTAFHKQVIGTERQNHPPTELPDASCFMPVGDTTPEDEDVEDGDAGDYGISVTPPSPYNLPPSAAPQLMEFNYESDESDAGDSDDDGDEDSDGSLDLLAVARELDPEAVRQHEREYDAQLAERLAEEIPAGSSAATAGGGSGWGSPASGVDREQWENARKAAKEARRGDRASGVKRRRNDVNGN